MHSLLGVRCCFGFGKSLVLLWLLTVSVSNGDERSTKTIMFATAATSNRSSAFPALRVPAALEEHYLHTILKEDKGEVEIEDKQQQQQQHPQLQDVVRNPKGFDFEGQNGWSPGERIRSQQQQQQRLKPGVYSCGHQGSETFINFINPRFPEHESSSGSCVFKVHINSPDICQLRVDFVDTELLSPEDGNCNDQYLSVGGATWPNGVKKLCGINSDQHFYVQVDQDTEEKNGVDKTVDFTITTVTSHKNYKFGFWITQVDCASRSPIEAPAGCTQYFLGRQGIIKSFNFEGVQYLANQNYRACIRTERDACFMSYEADPNHFMFQLFLDPDNRRFSNRIKGISSPSGRGEDDCGLDYVLIPAGRGNATRTGPSYDRFCGGRLNVESNEASSVPVYSEITSRISWIEVVTASRDDHVKLQLEANVRRRLRPSGNSFFSGFGGGNNRATINDNFESTGAGLRLKYNQINNCLSTSFFRK